MAMEILRMNGGSTLIRPGDVLALPEWNDPNLYIGANEFQGVLNQNAQNPNYKGATIAAVPDSQRAAWGVEQGLTGTSNQSTAPNVSGPNVFRQAGNFELNRMRGPQAFSTPGATNTAYNPNPYKVQQQFRQADAAQGGTAVQAPNIPRNIGQGRRDKGVQTPQPTSQPTGQNLSTSPMAMAGGNIGSLFASATNRNLNKNLAGKLVNPLYSSAVEAIQNPRGTSGSGKSPTATSAVSTGTNQAYLKQESQTLNDFINGIGTPPQSIAGAAASNVLGYQFDKKMAVLGYVYDPQTRRFRLVNPPTKPTDNSGLPPAPTSFQGVGQDWNQSHYPQAQFEYAGLDRGGGGAGGGVTGRTGTTAGYVALSTRVATG
jgi:hypothetical protein